MRKVLSIILISVLMVSLVPLNVFGQDSQEKELNGVKLEEEPQSSSLTTEDEETATEELVEEETTPATQDSKTESNNNISNDPNASEFEDEKQLEQADVEDQNNESQDKGNNAAEASSDTAAETKDSSESVEQSAKVKAKAVEEEVKYNEFGIKEGTMVYGLDISKLTEDQLKYIPKDWRDGVDESELESSEGPSLSAKAKYPDVNNWILKNSPSTAAVKNEHKNFFAQFDYRNGRGKVEGVVAHETANPNSTIRSEINFMSNNHNNAFVHAFVDHGNIIEIHPTDRAAWGAGYYANQRFVHVELVEVNSFENFAKSINNYSDYIASILYKYDLGVSDAEKSGRGTLWSHNAVSKFLGGTNHTDPIGYFAKWGYNWNDFVELVRIKYAEKTIVETSTSKIGHIRSTQSLIYSDLGNPQSGKKAGSNNTNKVYYIKKEAKRNGELYYLLSTKPSSTSGTIGWIRSKDATVHTHNSIDKTKREYTIDGNGKAYTKAWGGSKDFVFNLSSYKGKKFTVNLTEAVGKNVWLRGTVNGKQVWVHSSYVSAAGKTSNTSKLGHLKSKAKIYKNPLKPSTVHIAEAKDLNQVYYIKKQIVTNGETYYLISYSPSSTQNTVGWVNSKDMSTHTHTGVSKEPKTLYIKGNGTSYNKAWGGSKNIVYKNLSTKQGAAFKVNLTEKVGGNTWYRGKLDGKTMWIHSSMLISKTEKSTSRLGHLNSNAAIYTEPGVSDNKKIAKNGFTNSVYYIKKEAKIGNTTYYLISKQPSSKSGVVGWVKAGDMKTYAHTGYDKKAKKLYVRGTGKAYTKAWGGSKDLVYADLSKYKNQVLEVNLTEKVGGNTWYRGKLNGKQVWIHSSYLENR